MAEGVIFWLTNLARAEARLERARGQASAAVRRQSLGAGLAAELGAEASAARARQAAALREARALETRLREREAALTRLRERQRQVQNEREGAALARETAIVEAELGPLAEQALEALERAELLQVEARTSESEAVERQTSAAEAAPAATRAEAAAAMRIAALSGEVAACDAQLPPDVAATVAKLRGAVPPPVVAIEGGACGGCGARPPLQRALDVERGRLLLRCQGCGRYLVAAE
jgi:hypothetical protein